MRTREDRRGAGIDERKRFNTNGIDKSNLITATLWPVRSDYSRGHKTGSILYDHDFGGFDQRSNGLALLRPADYEFSGDV